MTNMKRRIDAIEKQLNFGQHAKQIRILPPLICGEPTNLTAKDTEKLGLVETWITYQEQLQAQEKANAEILKNNPNCLESLIMIELDVDKEYKARARQ